MMADGTIPVVALDSGGLPASERMRRIEEAVIRIENKLDGKVSHDDLTPVLQRIQLLESGETPLGRVMLQQWEGLTQTVAEINAHGSREAQEALRRINVLESDVDSLQRADISKRASDKENAVASDRHYRIMTIAVAILMVVLVGIQVYNSLKGVPAPTIHLIHR